MFMKHSNRFVPTHYLRILLCFWKNSLIREMSFRAHFFIKVVGELAWVGMTLIFLDVIFRHTSQIGGWSHHQYLFLMGTHLLITGIFEAFFFDNCLRVSELVRTGDLDFVLLRPANAQFLLSLERVNYSALANVPVALGLCGWAVDGHVKNSECRIGELISIEHLGLYVLLVAAGIVILYSLLFMFAITSIWFIRQTGLGDLWFYTVSFARYPAEIYKNFAGGVLWFALVFVIPILLVANLPASVVIRTTFDPFLVAYLVVAAVVLLFVSSGVFRLALRWYRSASS